ncbi:MAG TPA: DinB family protein [Ktedonobacterales bacterium]|nr:DinB family protein [Ktedonobacterales bacterium]
MATEDFTLNLFYTSWKEYQDHIRMALAPLTPEQLTLRAAPGLRSIGELAMHIIGGRAGWFNGFLGEESADMRALDARDVPDAPPLDAAELVQALERSWEFMAGCLARWSPADMRKTFEHTWRGDHYDLARSWVVWHVLEHDLHHGGEISLTLGMHGLPAPDI